MILGRIDDRRDGRELLRRLIPFVPSASGPLDPDRKAWAAVALSFLILALNTPTYSYAYHDATVDGLTRLTETMGLAVDAPTSPADTASAARI